MMFQFPSTAIFISWYFVAEPKWDFGQAQAQVEL
jgi:hypothetical protein